MCFFALKWPKIRFSGKKTSENQKFIKIRKISDPIAIYGHFVNCALTLSRLLSIE